MYIAYGWPKVLKGLARRDQRVVHMSSRGGLLLVVYSSAIQVWTDTQVPINAWTYQPLTKRGEALVGELFPRTWFFRAAAI